ncbi:MAG: hypothetical protein DYH18_09320 [Xanthomonadales bacterium PRO7]|nr:hypothetical protein [Xanthomonadales bacterium PRO7]
MKALLGLLGCVVVGSASAATFCVSNTGQFAAALLSAQANDQDDTIRVVAGTYILNAGLQFSSSEAHSISIIGSYDATCASLTTSSSTLDGQHQYQGLYVSNDNGSILISRLSFQSGYATGLDGGAGLFAGSVSGNVTVSLNRFTGNTATYNAGVSANTLHGSLTFSSNLLANNKASDFGAGFLFQDSGEAHVAGNTIVNNHNDPGQNTGGLVIGGGAHFTLANNILWGNTDEGGFDLYAGAAHNLLNNDLGVAGGTNPIPDFAQGNLSVDPGFVNCSFPFICFNPYALGSDSALVNAGDDSPPGILVGFVDLAYLPRKSGAHIDIGAYENQDVIFRDGFGS